LFPPVFYRETPVSCKPRKVQKTGLKPIENPGCPPSNHETATFFSVNQGRTWTLFFLEFALTIFFLAFGGRNFEVVIEYVYLRALVTLKNDMGFKIQRKIQIANRCFCGLRKYLRSSHLAIQTKSPIYKTLIRLVLLYGS
jgi:hypothetical protein